MVRVVTSRSLASASIDTPWRDDSIAWRTFHWRMTSWLRGTANPDGSAVLGFALRPPDVAAAPAVRRAGGLRCRAVDALDAPHLDFFRGRLGRHVVVEDARLGLLHMLIEDDADEDVLVAAERPRDPEAVSFVKEAMRFGLLPVDPG